MMSWTLGMTDTKLLGQPAGPRVATRKEAVDGMLRDLGKERDTRGCARHDKGSLFFLYAPTNWLSRLMLNAMTKKREELLKEGKADPKKPI